MHMYAASTTAQMQSARVTLDTLSTWIIRAAVPSITAPTAMVAVQTYALTLGQVRPCAHAMMDIP